MKERAATRQGAKRGQEAGGKKQLLQRGREREKNQQEEKRKKRVKNLGKKTRTTIISRAVGKILYSVRTGPPRNQETGHHQNIWKPKRVRKGGKGEAGERTYIEKKRVHGRSEMEASIWREKKIHTNRGERRKTKKNKKREEEGQHLVYPGGWKTKITAELGGGRLQKKPRGFRHHQHNCHQKGNGQRKRGGPTSSGISMKEARSTAQIAYSPISGKRKHDKPSKPRVPCNREGAWWGGSKMKIGRLRGAGSLL